MNRTWASSSRDLFRRAESPSGQRWSPGQARAGRKLHWLCIKKFQAVWPARIVCWPLIKHNDVIFRKLKRLLTYFCKKSSQTHFRSGKKKLKSVVGYMGPRHFLIHIFITIKWQFKQRNECCILIGVICSRISCIMHVSGGSSLGQETMCSRRCVRRKLTDFALSRCTSEKRGSLWGNSYFS